MNGDVNEQYIVSSLVRGLQILSTFTPKRPALKVSEIAEITGLDQATVFRFVYTLEKLGYLTRDEDTKRYHQSVRMLTLSLSARQGVAVREVALPRMFELSDKVNEIVTLSVLDGIEAITIGVIEIREKIVFTLPLGHRSPVYCTAMGKALMAFQPIETWDRLIPRIEFIQYTENTIVDPQQFRDELMRVRKQGYAVSDGELIANMGSIAAPVFNFHRDVAGAINISGFSMQVLHEDRTDYFIRELTRITQTVSAELGYIAELMAGD